MELRASEIQVVLAFCDPRGTYCRHAAATAASIFTNTRRSVTVHVLHDETLTDANRGKLEQLADSFGQSVAFHDVSAFMAQAALSEKGLPPGPGSKGTLFRLAMPQVLDAPRAIYLDCDVIVNRDIGDLWDQDLKGKAIAAVPDTWSLDLIERGIPLGWRKGYLWDLMAIAPGEYFNAGVLLLDQEKIRWDYNFAGAVAQVYRTFGACLTMADQDCLNAVFAHDKVLLDESFNRIRCDGVGQEDLWGTIWHLAGAKPWSELSRPWVDGLYWRYLAMTPYCTSQEELIHLMVQSVISGGALHRHSADCMKRLQAQMADNIFRAHIWTTPRMLWLELKQRLAHKRLR